MHTVEPWPDGWLCEFYCVSKSHDPISFFWANFPPKCHDWPESYQWWKGGRLTTL